MDVPCSNDPQMIHAQNPEQRSHSTGRRKLANSHKQLGRGEAIRKYQDLAQAKLCVTCVSIGLSEGKWTGLGTAHGNIPGLASSGLGDGSNTEN